MTNKILGISFETAGPSGALPVVLIHGFPFARAMWKPQVDVLSKQYQVVTFDVRGHGESEVGDGQYSIEFFVDDLIAVMGKLKIDKAVLCGLSMGGYIALRAVERHPERFNGLVLCDTKSESDGNEAKIKRSASIQAVKKDGVGPFAENFIKAVLAEGTLKTKPETVESVRQMINANTPQGISGALLALASRTDTTPSLAKIQAPTLILVGA